MQGERRPRKLRIGMLTDLYHPHLSGVTVHIDQVKGYLERKGHTVRVFAYGPCREGEKGRGVIRSPSLPWGIKYGQERLRPGFRLTSAARLLLESMDVIHVHHPFPAGLLGWRRSKHSGKPLVFTCHTRYDLHLKAIAWRALQAVGEAAVPAYLRRFCQVCDAVVSPSEGMRRMLKAWGIRKEIQVIRHGMDPGLFRNGDRGLSRARLGFSPHDAVVLYTGRLGEEKGLDILIESFRQVRSSHAAARLAIVGDGPERQRLRRLREVNGLLDAVRFAGKVPRREISDWLAAADVFATASRSEVYPISVIEARLAGLPVVGFRAPGLEEMVIDGRHGFLAATQEEFASSLRRVVADAPLRGKLAAASLAESAPFHEDSATPRLIRLYSGLAWGDRRRSAWGAL